MTLSGIIEETSPLTADDITQAIETLLATAWADIPPKKINNGMCADFAEEVCRFLSFSGHTIEGDWIKNPPMAHFAIPFNGLWFDAECPKGSLAENLPFWKRETCQIS